MKEPGDPAWCWQTISALQTMWKGLELDCDRYVRIWAEAEEHRVWEKVPYDAPYGTKDAMLEQLALGDDATARARVAVQAMPGRKSNRKGSNQRQGSTSADYLTSRIARDRPDVLERMRQGEFTSVAAAAREAGINVPKSKKVMVSGDKERLAKTIMNIFGPEEFRAFAEVVARLTMEEQADD